jgi:hypothetical protein
LRESEIWLVFKMLNKPIVMGEKVESSFSQSKGMQQVDMGQDLWKLFFAPNL